MSLLCRRSLLKTGAAASVIAATGLPTKVTATRGGILRLGLNGANSSDSFDGRTHYDTFMVNMGHGTVFDCLTEVTAAGERIGELAVSWEASVDAKIWTFNLRKGVTFHNGKSFGADDVIESLQMHTVDGTKSGAKPILAAITKIKKLGDYQVQLTLAIGNADFPFLLSDYHILMYPAGMVEEAIAKGIGTGMYKLVSFEPGVRCVVTRVDSHYKDGWAGWFDGIEAIAINDTSTRMDALINGQVDAVNRVDIKIESIIYANPNITIFEVMGNQHFIFPMLIDQAPFNDINVRKALKYSINRQEMVDQILRGHGKVGNDHPIGPANQYFASEIPQLELDIDRAKFHMKLAGINELNIDLSASDAAFNGATDAAQLYQASVKKAGININVVQAPTNDYWTNIWRKTGWCTSYCSGRATEDWMFSTAYKPGVPWNDGRWENARFEELYLKACAEFDSDKRRDQYVEMQMLCSAEGSVIVPMYANYVDAASSKLAHGPDVGNLSQMDSSRITERWWFA